MTPPGEPSVLLEPKPAAPEPWPAASPEFLASIPHEFARRHLILSEGCADESERLLTTERSSPAAVFNVGVRLGRAVRARTVPAEQLAAAIDRAYLNVASSEPAPEHDGPRLVVGISEDVQGDLVGSLLARRALDETDHAVHEGLARL